MVLINIDPYSSFLELGIHTFHHIKIYMFLLSVETVALLEYILEKIKFWLKNII